MASSLFQPITIGVANKLTLSHRIALAPLTRRRANIQGVPQPISVEYYGQRASYPGSLLISEATNISQQGTGYPKTPGIYTSEQVEAWKPICDAVHEAKSFLFMQLWHVGRVSHSSLQPNGQPPVSSYAIACSDGEAITIDGALVPYEVPRALTISDIEQVIDDYRIAAQNAKNAGCDGVEIHAANGYLIDQFLHNGINKRTDEYGGSIENRAKLLFRVIEAIQNVYPSDRIGVRLSPFGTFKGTSDSDPTALFTYVCTKLSDYNLAYLHLIEPRVSGSLTNDSVDQSATLATSTLRPHYKGVLIGAGGYTPESAKKAVDEGRVDMVAFGRYFISNPDLVKRIENNVPLTPYSRQTFYSEGTEGYTDYPFHNQEDFKA